MDKYTVFLKDLGLKVQFYRQKAGFSQAELANKISKSIDTISNIERGAISTKIETLLDICEALKIEFIDLVSKDEVSKTSKGKVRNIDEILKILAGLESQQIDRVLNVIRELIKFKD